MSEPQSSGAKKPNGSTKRILVLVPHDPDLDPRIAWSLSLCRRIAKTDVLATTWSTKKPVKEYDGVVSVERIEATVYASPLIVKISAALGRLDARRSAREFKEREGKPPTTSLARAQHHAGAAFRLAAAWGYYAIIVSALHRRGRAVSIPPKLILCHDIYALLPGAALKRRFGARLVYDTHEYFPESDLLAPRWQQRLTTAVERRFIRHADAVITVSPLLANELQRVYRLRRVISVPNAEPFPPSSPAPRPRDEGAPVRFLLQGQASPGRGIDRLFELWEDLDDDRAVLLVRTPDGDYPRELRERFASLFDSERAHWLPAVSERELVTAARSAHVGVIPYVGPSKNHLYASPNKLSQYMLAGLAILSNDLPYISSLISSYECGVTYNADDEVSLRRAVDRLVSDPESLQTMRERAFLAAKREFNWQTVGRDYEAVIADLFAS
ncbi:MAG: glycosyltransferase [Actinomycetota bacterium]|nr:glycosyltransferase [Actinomycetota bacterium]